MSTRSFVNALIGLAREYKMKERRAEQYQRHIKKQPCTRDKDCVRREGHHGKCTVEFTINSPSFGHEITQMMKEDGYFTPASAEVFGDAIESLLQSSTPKRKPK